MNIWKRPLMILFSLLLIWHPTSAALSQNPSSVRSVRSCACQLCECQKCSPALCPVGGKPPTVPAAPAAPPSSQNDWQVLASAASPGLSCCPLPLSGICKDFAPILSASPVPIF